VDQRCQFLPAHADVDGELFGAAVEAIEMDFQKDELPAVEADPLPDAVAQKKTAVKYRHFRLRPANNLPVHVNQNIFVSGVFQIFVCAGAHSCLILQALIVLSSSNFG
jgi:hypothetical protein